MNKTKVNNASSSQNVGKDSPMAQVNALNKKQKSKIGLALQKNTIYKTNVT